MRVQILKSPAPIESKPLELWDMPVPQPGPGQVRIRVKACGICRTDLHEAEGELALPKLPVVPGHQIVGTVDAAGPKTGRLKPGDRAGVPWLHEACGECGFCRRGDENLCDRPVFTGYTVDGGYAEYALAQEAFCCALPAGIGDQEAAPLLCAGIIGYRALRVAGVRPGETLGLFGFGASAHLALQVAAHWGCKVFVFSRGESHQTLALGLGAAWAGSPADAPPHPLDRAVSFAPAGAIIPQALSRLVKGGTLALAGIHLDEIPRMPYSLLYGERVLRSIANATRRDADEFLALAAKIPVRTKVRLFPLEEANEALRLLKQGAIDGAGVLAL